MPCFARQPDRRPLTMLRADQRLHALDGVAFSREAGVLALSVRIGWRKRELSIGESVVERFLDPLAS